MKELDRRLAILGRSEIDYDLRALESDVWRKVDARAIRGFRPMPNRMVAAFYAGAALFAALGGAATATAAAHAPSLAAAFAIHATWAPSTILGD